MRQKASAEPNSIAAARAAEVIFMAAVLSGVFECVEVVGVERVVGYSGC